VRETTALGAAIAAGFAIGVWKDFDELKEVNRKGRTHFRPQVTTAQADKMYGKWNKAVEMSRGWGTGEADVERKDEEKGEEM
jgi:glycerol kinase